MWIRRCWSRRIVVVMCQAGCLSSAVPGKSGARYTQPYTARDRPQRLGSPHYAWSPSSRRDLGRPWVPRMQPQQTCCGCRENHQTGEHRRAVGLQKAVSGRTRHRVRGRGGLVRIGSGGMRCDVNGGERRRDGVHREHAEECREDEEKSCTCRNSPAGCGQECSCLHGVLLRSGSVTTRCLRCCIVVHLWALWAAIGTSQSWWLASVRPECAHDLARRRAGCRREYTFGAGDGFVPAETGFQVMKFVPRSGGQEKLAGTHAAAAHSAPGRCRYYRSRRAVRAHRQVSVRAR